jgi:arylsulfatase A-like enzyme
VNDALYGRFDDLDVPLGKEALGTLRPKVLIEGGSTDIDLYVARYDGEIAYVDDEIGRLLGRVREMGLDDETLVILTSDHGESLTERQLYFQHGMFAYEEHTRVPLILRYPPILPAGQVPETVIESIDLMPTVLDLLGLPANPLSEGRSLLPLMLGGEPSAPGLAFSEAASHPEKLIRAIWKDGWKLVFHPEGADLGRDPFRPRVLLSPRRVRALWWAVHGGPGAGRRWELYDLRSDPGEQVNLVQERPDVFASLRRDLEAWIASAPPNREDPTVDLDELSPDVVENLRALGYIQ